VAPGGGIKISRDAKPGHRQSRHGRALSARSGRRWRGFCAGLVGFAARARFGRSWAGFCGHGVACKAARAASRSLRLAAFVAEIFARCSGENFLPFDACGALGGIGSPRARAASRSFRLACFAADSFARCSSESFLPFNGCGALGGIGSPAFRRLLKRRFRTASREVQSPLRSI
jgi:hypothetical protein